MPGNSFGSIFRITTFGESHGEAIGVVIDGCPAGFPLDINRVQTDLDRRRPGQTSFSTARDESDRVSFLSGIYEGKTTGTPIMGIVYNKDSRSKDYDHLKDTFRPSHADFTYQKKYGHRDPRGGGRSSARETVGWVIAGAIAKQMLEKIGVQTFAYVSQIGKIRLNKNYLELNLDKTEESLVRCPDLLVSEVMIKAMEEAKKNGDSLGGVITGVIKGVPSGLGEPIFNKLHADLGKAMLSINAVKGFEYGSGFRGVENYGSQENDPFVIVNDQIKTAQNNSGGIQGGISNGMDIYFNVAFKPVATILQTQKSVNLLNQEIEVMGKGRHDACVVPRAVPIVEALSSLVILDHYLRNKTVQWEQT